MKQNQVGQSEIGKIPRMYSAKEIILKLNRALGLLYKNDAFLLKEDVNERSISHKLAEYLQKSFMDYDVDCEYNWQMDNFKDKNNKNVSFNREEEKFYPKSDEDKIKDNNAHMVYPDIIIHKRGNNYHNLLIIEIKKSSNNGTMEREKDKLKLKKDKEKFGYAHTLYLDIPTGEDFTNNKKIGFEFDKTN